MAREKEEAQRIDKEKYLISSLLGPTWQAAKNIAGDSGCAKRGDGGGRRRGRGRLRRRSNAPRRSVETVGRRQAAGPGPAMAWRNRPEPESKLVCDTQLGESDTRRSTHLSDGSRWLYYTIRNDGDGPLPQEPSEVDESSGERLWSAGPLVNLVSGKEGAHKNSPMFLLKVRYYCKVRFLLLPQNSAN